MDGSSWYEIHDQSPVRNVKKRYCSFALSRSIECASSDPDTYAWSFLEYTKTFRADT
jgi:hypothetical protein